MVNINRGKPLLPCLALAGLLLTSGCARILSEKVTPYPDAAPHAAPWRLNRELLLPETTSRIVFLVQRLDGVNPLSEPLDHLVEIASKYGERPASWARLGDPGSPDLETDRNGVLRCPDGPLDPRTSYVLVHYVGSFGPGMFGRTVRLRAAAECGERDIYAIEIAQDTLAHHRFLWLTRRSLEENDLVHEYGHVLGLGSNPAHGFYPDYPDFSSGDHCVNPNCALASPLPRAALYRFYKTGMTFRSNRDYCSQCRLDIAQAKKHWRTGEVFPESARLPQQDLSGWITGLKDEDFQEGGKATALLYHGKEIMPALMKRIYTLPRDGDDSPAAVAEWIAKTIVSQEAVDRAGEGYKVEWAANEDSHAMGWWWMKERRRFMAGGSWELPPSLSLVPEDADRTPPAPASTSPGSSPPPDR